MDSMDTVAAGMFSKAVTVDLGPHSSIDKNTVVLHMNATGSSHE
jgi:hypothetical protein